MTYIVIFQEKRALSGVPFTHAATLADRRIEIAERRPPVEGGVLAAP